MPQGLLQGFNRLMNKALSTRPGMHIYIYITLKASVMDTCICMAESLRYTPETITLLIYCVCLCVCVCVCVSVCVSHSVVTDSVTPWTVTRQAPLSMGFPRQEYWSGLPCPPLGDLPGPQTELTSVSPALAGRFFTTESPGKPINDF